MHFRVATLVHGLNIFSALAQERMETFAPLFEMARRGLLRTKVEKMYPLAEAREALAHAAQAKRGGKIVFRLDA